MIPFHLCMGRHANKYDAQRLVSVITEHDIEATTSVCTHYCRTWRVWEIHIRYSILQQQRDSL